MANSYTHAGLPYPIYNAKYTLLIPYLDADGDPTDPTTPDTEISKDGGSFADCTEEVTTITGSNGTGYITLTGAEMQCVAAAICGKVASGPKATLAFLQPRVLPVISNGTAQSGGNTAITLTSGAPAYDLTGCFVRTTGGTGGGGTNGANNQARMITAYNVSTKEATVFPAWETNPANDTTYDILLSDLSVNNPVNTDVDTLLSRIVGTLAAGTHNPQSGDSYSRIGTNGAGLTALGDTRLNNLDAAVSSRSTLTAQQVWEYTTRTLSAFGFNVTVGTNNDKTGYALSVSGVSAVQSGLSTLTAQQVWEYATRTLSAFGFNVTVGTNNDKTGYSLSATPPTAAAIADAVWDEATSGHTGAGSTGAAIVAAGSAGDPWSASLPGAYGAGTAGNIVGNRIDAAVSTRLATSGYTSPPSASDIATAVWGATTRTLSSFGTLVSDISTAVWGATTRTLSAFGFTVAATVADKTGYSLSSASITSVQSGLAKTTDITALNDISVTDILAGETESGLTLKHAIQIITALALKATGGGTSSISFRNYGDTKNRLTMTVDEDGNRTAVTISLD